MDYKEEEIEIDLIKLCKYLLHKWKQIVLCAVLFGLGGLGYVFYQQGFSLHIGAEDVTYSMEREVQQPNKTVKKEVVPISHDSYVQLEQAKQAEFDSEMMKKQLNDDLLKLEISKIEQDLANLESYLKDAVLMDDKRVFYEAVYYYATQDDPASPIIFASDDPQTLIAETRSVYNFVRLCKRSPEFVITTAQKLGLEGPLEVLTRHISDYISLKRLDPSTFTLVITAETPQRLELLKHEIMKLNEELRKFMAPVSANELKISLISEYEVGADKFANFRIEMQTELKRLQLRLAEKKAALALQSTEIPVLEALPAPSNPVKTLLQKLAKFGAVGVLLGLMISCGSYCLSYILKGCLRDAGYLSRIVGLRNIACLHENGFGPLNTQEELKLKTFIGLLCKDYRKLSVVSTLNNDEIDRVLEILKQQLPDKELMITSASLVTDISDSDAVILVEKLDVSELKGVMTEVEVVKDLKKDLLGIVYA